jgi:hypothetical protein
MEASQLEVQRMVPHLDAGAQKFLLSRQRAPSGRRLRVDAPESLVRDGTAVIECLKSGDD